MALPTPTEATNKLINRVQGAQTEYLKGIDAVQVNPMEQAAQKANKAKLNYSKAIDDGKWARGLRRVSFDQWKTITKQKGQERWASGVNQAKQKIQTFFSQFIPFLESHLRVINAMPTDTDVQREQKMLENMRGIKKFKNLGNLLEGA